ncbi:MAG: uracil-DNA glycosylase family protein [bacterium]
MSGEHTVGAELAAWVAAARGSLEWLIETGELEVEVPADFVPPRLGEVPAAAPRSLAHLAARLGAPEVPDVPELQSVLERSLGVPGLPPQPRDFAAEIAGVPEAAAETTFIDSPSLLEGPAEAALVFGWSGVRVAFVAGPVPDDAPPSLMAEVGALVERMAQGIKLGLGQVFFGYLAGPDGQRPSAPAARRAVRRQLVVARPEVIVALGDFATRALCGSDESFKRCRGVWHDFEGVPVMPTFHPEAMIQGADSQRLKAAVWDDLKKVMRRLNGGPKTG